MKPTSLLPVFIECSFGSVIYQATIGAGDYQKALGDIFAYATALFCAYVTQKASKP